MFRTAVLRSARCLVQAAPRAQVSAASRVIPSSFAQSRTAAPSAMIPSIRFYSAHAGLSQDEVQGRILDLLKNFDKVRPNPSLECARKHGTNISLSRSPIRQRYPMSPIIHNASQYLLEPALPHRTLHQRPRSRQLGHSRGRHGHRGGSCLSYHERVCAKD